MGKHGATVAGCKKIGRGRPHWVKKHGKRYKKCGKKLKGHRRKHRSNLMNMAAMPSF